MTIVAILAVFQDFHRILVNTPHLVHATAVHILFKAIIHDLRMHYIENRITWKCGDHNSAFSQKKKKNFPLFTFPLSKLQNAFSDLSTLYLKSTFKCHFIVGR